MFVLKVLGIVLAVFVILFLLSLVIYFFNLDMKFASALIGPLTKYYDWSAARREQKKRKTDNQGNREPENGAAAGKRN